MIYADGKEGNKKQGENKSSFAYDRESYRYDSSKCRKKAEEIDIYTGEKISRGEAQLDHKISLKTIDDNGGYMLNQDEKKKIANDGRNLGFTKKEINSTQFKGDKKATEAFDTTEKIPEGVTREKCEKADVEGEKVLKEYVNINVKTKYYAKETAKIAVKDMGKAGLRTLIIFMIKKITTEFFIIIKKIGFTIKNIWLALKEAFINLITDYKSIFEELKATVSTSFFATITTTLINLFATTIKSIIGAIRTLISMVKKATSLKNKSQYERKKMLLQMLVSGLSSLIIINGTNINEFTAGLFRKIPILITIADELGVLISAFFISIGVYAVVNIIEKMVKIFKQQELLTKQMNAFRMENKIAIIETTNSYVRTLGAIDILMKETQKFIYDYTSFIEKSELQIITMNNYNQILIDNGEKSQGEHNDTLERIKKMKDRRNKKND